MGENKTNPALWENDRFEVRDVPGYEERSKQYQAQCEKDMGIPPNATREEYIAAVDKWRAGQKSNDK